MKKRLRQAQKQMNNKARLQKNKKTSEHRAILNFIQKPFSGFSFSLMIYPLIFIALIGGIKLEAGYNIAAAFKLASNL